MSHQHGKEKDPFLCNYQPSDLRIASEFLTTWLPFLSRDLCHDCTQLLTNRIRTLDSEIANAEAMDSDENIDSAPPTVAELPKKNGNQDETLDANSPGNWKYEAETNLLGSWKDVVNKGTEARVAPKTPSQPLTKTSRPRMSWADMMQEDELEEDEDESESEKGLVSVNALTGKLTITKDVEKPKLSREQRECIRFNNVGRKKDFICLERLKGKIVNIVEGLELHTGIFSAVEQKRIVDHIYALQEMGKRGELRERTFSAPRKWMKGKGRVTIQFGCCYNYATDRNGNPPGILPNETVDPIPPLFKVIIRRLVRWRVLPPTCIPDSCIVNIYEEGDCIPPHIDNHDFVRPFCTVSFLSECNIVFGTNLSIVGPGEFSGPVSIPLPVGSVLVLKGNGADVAKHCVPAVPKKRISITFRRMDDLKRPFDYTPEPDLLDIEQLPCNSSENKVPESPVFEPETKRHPIWRDNMKSSGSANRTNNRFDPHYSSYEPVGRRRRKGIQDS